MALPEHERSCESAAAPAVGVAAAAGERHTLLLDGDGRVVEWGAIGAGEQARVS